MMDGEQVVAEQDVSIHLRQTAVTLGNCQGNGGIVLNTPHGVSVPAPLMLCVPVSARDIGVVVEQVQRPPVVGHLVGTVGPHDDPEGILVNAGPRFRPL